MSERLDIERLVRDPKTRVIVTCGSGGVTRQSST